MANSVMVTLTWVGLTQWFSGMPVEAIGKSPDLRTGEADGIKSLTLLKC